MSDPSRARGDLSGFVDRVMATVSVVPTPTPTRSLIASLRHRAARDAWAAVLVAWHLATVRHWQVAGRVRVRSMALVFAVVSVLATGSLVAAATVQVVAPPLVELAPKVLDGTWLNEQGPVEHGQDGVDESGPANDASMQPAVEEFFDASDDLDPGGGQDADDANADAADDPAGPDADGGQATDDANDGANGDGDTDPQPPANDSNTDEDDDQGPRDRPEPSGDGTQNDGDQDDGSSGG